MAEEVDGDLKGLPTLMLAGSCLGLVVIPVCIFYRARVFQSR